MIIRYITQDEKAEFMSLCRYAFGNWSNEAVKDEEVSWLEPGETLCVFEDNRIVSGLICYSLKQNIRNKIMRMGGIGAVATYPEMRRKGYVKALMKEVFRKMKEMDIPVSMLSPFKESYYQQYEYAVTTGHLELKFNPAAIPREEIAGDIAVIRTDSANSWERYLRFQQKAVQKIHGLVNPGISKINHLYSKCRNSMFVFFSRDNYDIAFIRYSKSYKEKGEIEIDEVFWFDEAGRKAVFSFLSLHLDQIDEISMPVAFGVNFYNWFDNATAHLSASIKNNPWMVRIIDVKKALEGIPVGKEGQIIISIEDKYCPWNEGNYLISGADGILHCLETVASAEIALNISELSALLYGSFSPEEIAGKFNGKVSSMSLNTLQNWFTQKWVFNTCRF